MKVSEAFGGVWCFLLYWLYALDQKFDPLRKKFRKLMENLKLLGFFIVICIVFLITSDDEGGSECWDNK